jgi:hypothetical protein
MIALDVPLAWTPGEQTEVPVMVVYAVVTGSGFVVVLGTALAAWWLSRRARRKEAGLTRVPEPRRARRVKAATAAPAEGPDIVGGAHAGPIEVVTTSTATGPAALPTTSAAASAAPAPATVPPTVPAPRPAPAAIDLGRPPVRHHPDPRWTNDASGEYVLMRAATARAQTVAAQARNSSQEASSLLDTAERVYEEARKAHAESLAATPDPVPSNGSDADRDVARAALDAYRRGDLSVEELRKVWYGTSGWDERHDEAEQRIREFRAAEVQARQQYHIALAKARAARQAEYVADTAVRALGAETAAAASELAAAHDNARPKRKWLRNRAAAAGAPAR